MLCRSTATCTGKHCGRCVSGARPAGGSLLLSAPNNPGIKHYRWGLSAPVVGDYGWLLSAPVVGYYGWLLLHQLLITTVGYPLHQLLVTAVGYSLHHLLIVTVGYGLTSYWLPRLVTLCTSC